MPTETFTSPRKWLAVLRRQSLPFAALHTLNARARLETHTTQRPTSKAHEPSPELDLPIRVVIADASAGGATKHPMPTRRRRRQRLLVLVF